jgi:hypothetical protein
VDHRRRPDDRAQHDERPIDDAMGRWISLPADPPGSHVERIATAIGDAIRSK